MLCHLLPLLGWMIIGPLIIWLIKRETSPFVDRHGKECINYNISMLCWFIISFILCFVLIGFLLIFPLAILNIVWSIQALIAAQAGRDYRYPLTIRFLT